MTRAFEAWFHSDVLDGFGGVAPNARLLYNVQQKPDGTESFHTKNILNKETKTMKRLALLISAVVTVHGTTLAASVFDDAKVWFRGGYDANSDSVFSANEFSDSARPKSDTAHQTVTISGSGVAYGKGAVWSAFNPFYTNTQYYVSLPNGDCAAAEDCSSIKIVNPLASDESWSQFTIFVRFRWDGKFAPGSANRIDILNTGVNWGGKRCFKFGFKYFTSTDDFAPWWEIGAVTDGSNPANTAGLKFPVGEWRDMVVTVVDRGVGSYASMNLYMAEAGTITNPGGAWPSLTKWTGTSGNSVCRVGLASTDAITIGTATFSGDIAAFALWPKVLTYDEMREAFGALRPGDALFRIGKEDGKADEFAASGREQYTIDANGTWDVVPSVLDGTHNTLTINFDVQGPDSQFWSDMNQILRLVAVSGSGWIEGVVTDTERNRVLNLEPRRIAPGHPADFFVPGYYLRYGPHTLTLKFVRGSGVVFDVIEMRGSFCLGQIDYNKARNEQFKGTAKNSGTAVYHYDIATGYWRAMYSGIANDTFSDTWNGNSEASAENTVFFDVPADLVGCTNMLHISYNNFPNGKISPPDVINGYINDTLFYASTTVAGSADGKEWDWEVVPLVIPPNTFVPGRNAFRLRRVYSSGTWWGGIRGLRIAIQNGPPPDKTGMVIILR